MEGSDALGKFALSLFVVKEMSHKHPYLKTVANNYLNGKWINSQNVLKAQNGLINYS